MMRPAWRIIGVLAWWLALAVIGHAQEPQVRASLSTTGETWVGQRVTLVVELLAPGYFSGAPAFDLPVSPGVLILPPTDHPTVGSETIGDTSYTVQRHELSIFTRRAGAISIPSFPVRFHYKRQPLDHESVAGSVKTPPLTLTVKAPPGAEKLGSILSARGLTATETWQPEPKSAEAGAAFVRTIVFAAPDVPAMAFPSFPAAPIDGLGIYRKAPEVLDHSERGELRGQRRDTVTYVAQRPGHYLIPAVQLTWFDLETQKLQTIEFPARALEVFPNPALAAAVAKDATALREAQANRSLLTALAASLGSCALIAALGYWSAALRPLLRPFRPVHLSPLNPAPHSPTP